MTREALEKKFKEVYGVEPTFTMLQQFHLPVKFPSRIEVKGFKSDISKAYDFARFTKLKESQRRKLFIDKARAYVQEMDKSIFDRKFSSAEVKKRAEGVRYIVEAFRLTPTEAAIAINGALGEKRFNASVITYIYRFSAKGRNKFKTK